ncbi:unnamed protein product [Effrenium voratum]|nr:unnamed protein product [Effrenium voratum]
MKRAAILGRRAFALRVRRTLPAPSNLNTTFPYQKAALMSPQFRDGNVLEGAGFGGMRPPLPFGGPLTPPPRKLSGGFPLLQVSSWLRDDAQSDLRTCDEESPFSTAAILERSTGALRKRRLKHPPQRVVIPQPAEEEEVEGNFSVSGVRLGGRGARGARHVERPKELNLMSQARDWRRDPAALAEALTIALGRLQESCSEAEDDPREQAEASGYPESCKEPVRSQEREGDDAQGDAKEMIKGTSLSFAGDESPWPKQRRASRSALKAISRSKSLPEKSEKAEKEKAGPEKEKEKRGEDDRQATDKAEKAALERERAAAAADKARRGKPLSLKTGGKVRKKGLGRKMVLPFAYGSEDPRYWHVESTEGRICPEFLPERA